LPLAYTGYERVESHKSCTASARLIVLSKKWLNVNDSSSNAAAAATIVGKSMSVRASPAP